MYASKKDTKSSVSQPPSKDIAEAPRTDTSQASTSKTSPQPSTSNVEDTTFATDTSQASTSKTSPQPSTSKVEDTTFAMPRNAFSHFCTEVIEGKLKTENKLMTMKKLTKLYKQASIEVDHIELSKNYRTSFLKKRLIKKYPNMQFAKEKNKSKSEVAFFSKKKTASFVISRDEIQDSTSSQSEMDTESDNSNSNSINSSIASDSEVSSEAEDEVHDRKRNVSADTVYSESELREIYLASQMLKQSIKEKTETSYNLDRLSDITDEEMIKFIPPVLFNFLAWTCNFSNEFQSDYVELDSKTTNKIVSISQDILSLFSKKYVPPKQVLLGMAAKHITGSERLIKILTGLGHSVSPSTLERITTDFAEKEIKDSVPASLSKGQLTTFVWDNIDFNEETVTGAKSTHCVNGIAVQYNVQDNVQEISREIFQSSNKIKKPGKRKFDSEGFSNIVPYMKKKKTDPQISIDEARIDSAREEVTSKLMNIRKDELYFLLKSMPHPPEKQQPSWSGFNSVMCTNIPEKSCISYLPIIDGNATDMSTVNTILHKTIEYATSLEQEMAVIVADQAIYAKAQQIRWGDENLTRKLVLRLGEFHTLVAFMAAIGK